VQGRTWGHAVQSRGCRARSLHALACNGCPHAKPHDDPVCQSEVGALRHALGTNVSPRRHEPRRRNTCSVWSYIAARWLASASSRALSPCQATRAPSTRDSAAIGRSMAPTRNGTGLHVTYAVHAMGSRRPGLNDRKPMEHERILVRFTATAACVALLACGHGKHAAVRDAGAVIPGGRGGDSSLASPGNARDGGADGSISPGRSPDAGLMRDSGSARAGSGGSAGVTANADAGPTPSTDSGTPRASGVGGVSCGSKSCLAPDVCCFTPGSMSGAAGSYACSSNACTPASEVSVECDGKEDCAGKSCCLVFADGGAQPSYLCQDSCSYATIGCSGAGNCPTNQHCCETTAGATVTTRCADSCSEYTDCYSAADCPTTAPICSLSLLLPGLHFCHS
jgi:hypothetical protein